MIALNHFNQLSGEHAVAVLEPCVAISGWAAALVMILLSVCRISRSAMQC